MDLLAATQKTRAYASFFGFSLFPREIHHWLISSDLAPISKVSAFAGSLSTKTEIAKRRYLTFSSLNKIRIARRLGRIVRWLPGIKLVALTGSVAANNSHTDDDIDLLIVTSGGVLWLVRPFFLLLITIFFRRRLPHEDPTQTKDAFCPNLWLDHNHLTLPKTKRSLYTAHEVLQVFPIVDKGSIYQKFLRRNSWAKKHLANAYQTSTFSVPSSKLVRDSLNPFIIILMPLNYLFYLAQQLYMFPKKTTELVGYHSAFLHTNNYTHKLNQHISSFQDI